MNRVTKRKGDRVYINTDIIPSACTQPSFCEKKSCVCAGEKDSCPYLVILYRLAELEDKIESGELKELPCKIGETMYVVSSYYTGSWEIFECKVDSITMYGTHTIISLISVKGNFTFGENVSSINKNVFFTEEEAKKAWAKMKLTTYTFNFKGGQITVRALDENQARILAQAEAINRCWDYEIQERR